MQTQYESSTVEMDHQGFDDLKDQILNNKSDPDPVQEEKTAPKERKKQVSPSTSNKKYLFRRGDQSLEVDDDFEIEIMADKKPTTLTLRELKERAAGDIAVKNRMHSLAEEKKKVLATFREFTELAKTDPLGALEYISTKAKDADGEFEYNKYIEKLAEQAEKLGQMDEKDRKSWELEKKLKKAEQDLSHKERQAAVVLRKQELQSTYPEIGDSQFGQMVDAVLGNDELSEGLENEHDVMDKVEELIQETLTQKDILTVIKEINPSYLNDTDLVFSLSDQIRQNPDLDENDVRDIVSALIEPQRRVSKPVDIQRQKDSRTLSRKARQASPNITNRQSSTPFDLLKAQLLENKNEINKTPKYKR